MALYTNTPDKHSSKALGILKRVLGAFLAAVMLVSTLAVQGWAGLKVDNDISGMSPVVEFKVPETIYLKASDQKTVEYFVGYDAGKNLTSNMSDQRTGYVFFNAPGATDVAIKYEYVKGTKTASGVLSSVLAYNPPTSGGAKQTISLPAGSQIGGMTGPEGGTALVKWTATYKFNGTACTSYAYSIIYAPYKYEAGYSRNTLTVDLDMGWSTWWGDGSTFAMNYYNFLAGVHSVSGGTQASYFYLDEYAQGKIEDAGTTTGGNGYHLNARGAGSTPPNYSLFGDHNDNDYLGEDAAKEAEIENYHIRLPSSNAAKGGLFKTVSGHNGVVYGGTSLTDQYETLSANGGAEIGQSYYFLHQLDKRSNHYNTSFWGSNDDGPDQLKTIPYGNLTVDLSRYSNLSQIPNLMAGFDQLDWQLGVSASLQPRATAVELSPLATYSGSNGLKVSASWPQSEVKQHSGRAGHLSGDLSPVKSLSGSTATALLLFSKYVDINFYSGGIEILEGNDDNYYEELVGLNLDLTNKTELRSLMENAQNLVTKSSATDALSTLNTQMQALAKVLCDPSKTAASFTATDKTAFQNAASVAASNGYVEENATTTRASVTVGAPESIYYAPGTGRIFYSIYGPDNKVPHTNDVTHDLSPAGNGPMTTYNNSGNAEWRTNTNANTALVYGYPSGLSGGSLSIKAESLDVEGNRTATSIVSSIEISSVDTKLAYNDNSDGSTANNESYTLTPNGDFVTVNTSPKASGAFDTYNFSFLGVQRDATTGECYEGAIRWTFRYTVGGVNYDTVQITYLHASPIEQAGNAAVMYQFASRDLEEDYLGDWDFYGTNNDNDTYVSAYTFLTGIHAVDGGHTVSNFTKNATTAANALRVDPNITTNYGRGEIVTTVRHNDDDGGWWQTYEEVSEDDDKSEPGPYTNNKVGTWGGQKKYAPGAPWDYSGSVFPDNNWKSEPSAGGADVVSRKYVEALRNTGGTTDILKSTPNGGVSMALYGIMSHHAGQFEWRSTWGYYANQRSVNYFNNNGTDLGQSPTTGVVAGVTFPKNAASGNRTDMESMPNAYLTVDTSLFDDYQKIPFLSSGGISFGSGRAQTTWVYGIQRIAEVNGAPSTDPESLKTGGLLFFDNTGTDYSFAGSNKGDDPYRLPFGSSRHDKNITTGLVKPKSSSISDTVVTTHTLNYAVDMSAMGQSHRDVLKNTFTASTHIGGFHFYLNLNTLPTDKSTLRQNYQKATSYARTVDLYDPDEWQAYIDDLTKAGLELGRVKTPVFSKDDTTTYTFKTEGTAGTGTGLQFAHKSGTDEATWQQVKPTSNDLTKWNALIAACANNLAVEAADENYTWSASTADSHMAHGSTDTTKIVEGISNTLVNRSTQNHVTWGYDGKSVVAGEPHCAWYHLYKEDTSPTAGTKVDGIPDGSIAGGNRSYLEHVKRENGQPFYRDSWPEETLTSYSTQQEYNDKFKVKQSAGVYLLPDGSSTGGYAAYKSLWESKHPGKTAPPKTPSAADLGKLRYNPDTGEVYYIGYNLYEEKIPYCKTSTTHEVSSGFCTNCNNATNIAYVTVYHPMVKPTVGVPAATANQDTWAAFRAQGSEYKDGYYRVVDAYKLKPDGTLDTATEKRVLFLAVPDEMADVYQNGKDLQTLWADATETRRTELDVYFNGARITASPWPNVPGYLWMNSSNKAYLYRWAADPAHQKKMTAADSPTIVDKGNLLYLENKTTPQTPNAITSYNEGIVAVTMNNGNNIRYYQSSGGLATGGLATNKGKELTLSSTATKDWGSNTDTADAYNDSVLIQKGAMGRYFWQLEYQRTTGIKVYYEFPAGSGSIPNFTSSQYTGTYYKEATNATINTPYTVYNDGNGLFIENDGGTQDNELPPTAYPDYDTTRDAGGDYKGDYFFKGWRLKQISDTIYNGDADVDTPATATWIWAPEDAVLQDPSQSDPNVKAFIFEPVFATNKGQVIVDGNGTGAMFDIAKADTTADLLPDTLLNYVALNRENESQKATRAAQVAAAQAAYAATQAAIMADKLAGYTAAKEALALQGNTTPSQEDINNYWEAILAEKQAAIIAAQGTPIGTNAASYGKELPYFESKEVADLSGTKVTISNVKRPGYTFAGWAVYSEYGDGWVLVPEAAEFETFDDPFDADDEQVYVYQPKMGGLHKLVAQWIPVPQVVRYYDTEGKYVEQTSEGYNFNGGTLVKPDDANSTKAAIAQAAADGTPLGGEAYDVVWNYGDIQSLGLRSVPDGQKFMGWIANYDGYDLVAPHTGYDPTDYFDESTNAPRYQAGNTYTSNWQFIPGETAFDNLIDQLKAKSPPVKNTNTDPPILSFYPVFGPAQIEVQYFPVETGATFKTTDPNTLSDYNKIVNETQYTINENNYPSYDDLAGNHYVLDYYEVYYTTADNNWNYKAGQWQPLRESTAIDDNGAPAAAQKFYPGDVLMKTDNSNGSKVIGVSISYILNAPIARIAIVAKYKAYVAPVDGSWVQFQNGIVVQNDGSGQYTYVDDLAAYMSSKSDSRATEEHDDILTNGITWLPLTDKAIADIGEKPTVPLDATPGSTAYTAYEEDLAAWNAAYAAAMKNSYYAFDATKPITEINGTPEPTLEGYRFVGYLLKEAKYAGTTTDNTPITFSAKAAGKVVGISPDGVAFYDVHNNPLDLRDFISSAADKNANVTKDKDTDDYGKVDTDSTTTYLFYLEAMWEPLVNVRLKFNPNGGNLLPGIYSSPTRFTFGPKDSDDPLDYSDAAFPGIVGLDSSDQYSKYLFDPTSVGDSPTYTYSVTYGEELGFDPVTLFQDLYDSQAPSAAYVVADGYFAWAPEDWAPENDPNRHAVTAETVWNGETTLYRIWKPAEGVFKVQIDFNGGAFNGVAGSSIPLTTRTRPITFNDNYSTWNNISDATGQIPLDSALSRAGYTFNGWYSTTDTIEKLKNAETGSPEHPAVKFTLPSDTVDHDKITEQKYIHPGSVLTTILEADWVPIKNGAEVLFNPNPPYGEGSAVTNMTPDGRTTITDSDTDYAADYAKGFIYKQTFTAGNDPSDASPKFPGLGTQADPVDSPAGVYGYKFVGWHKNSVSGTLVDTETKLSPENPLSNRIYLVAKWEVDTEQTLRIIFHTNGGYYTYNGSNETENITSVGVIAEQTFPSLKIPQVKRAGYVDYPADADALHKSVNYWYVGNASGPDPSSAPYTYTPNTGDNSSLVNPAYASLEKDENDNDVMTIHLWKLWSPEITNPPTDPGTPDDPYDPPVNPPVNTDGYYLYLDDGDGNLVKVNGVSRWDIPPYEGDTALTFFKAGAPDLRILGSGEAAYSPLVTSPTGKYFAGWYYVSTSTLQLQTGDTFTALSDANTDRVTNTTLVSSYADGDHKIVILKAKWEKLADLKGTLTVRYHLLNNLPNTTHPDQTQVVAESNFNALTNWAIEPTRAGYEFVGWCLGDPGPGAEPEFTPYWKDNSGNAADSESATVKEFSSDGKIYPTQPWDSIVDLYAIWKGKENGITITLKGGTTTHTLNAEQAGLLQSGQDMEADGSAVYYATASTPANPTNLNDVYYDGKEIDGGLPVPTAAGWVFEGWIVGDGKGEITFIAANQVGNYTLDYPLLPAGSTDITLTAKWVADSNENNWVRVYFHTQGGSKPEGIPAQYELTEVTSHDSQVPAGWLDDDCDTGVSNDCVWYITVQAGTILGSAFSPYTGLDGYAANLMWYYDVDTDNNGKTSRSDRQPKTLTDLTYVWDFAKMPIDTLAKDAQTLPPALHLYAFWDSLNSSNSLEVLWDPNGGYIGDATTGARVHQWTSRSDADGSIATNGDTLTTYYNANNKKDKRGNDLPYGPIRAGYEFNYWYYWKDGDPENKVMVGDDTVLDPVIDGSNPGNSLKFYADWSPVEDALVIQVWPNGGTRAGGNTGAEAFYSNAVTAEDKLSSSLDSDFFNGTAYSETAFIKSGEKFIGFEFWNGSSWESVNPDWAIRPNIDGKYIVSPFTNADIKDDAPIAIDNTGKTYYIVTLRAKYEPAGVLVVYHPQGGAFTASYLVGSYDLSRDDISGEDGAIPANNGDPAWAGVVGQPYPHVPLQIRQGLNSYVFDIYRPGYSLIGWRTDSELGTQLGTYTVYLETGPWRLRDVDLTLRDGVPSVDYDGQEQAIAEAEAIWQALPANDTDALRLVLDDGYGNAVPGGPWVIPPETGSNHNTFAEAGAPDLAIRGSGDTAYTVLVTKEGYKFLGWYYVTEEFPSALGENGIPYANRDEGDKIGDLNLSEPVGNSNLVENYAHLLSNVIYLKAKWEQITPDTQPVENPNTPDSPDLTLYLNDGAGNIVNTTEIQSTTDGQDNTFWQGGGPDLSIHGSGDSAYTPYVDSNGRVFLGWYTQDGTLVSNGSYVNEINEAGENKLTLYAHWGEPETTPVDPTDPNDGPGYEIRYYVNYGMAVPGATAHYDANGEVDYYYIKAQAGDPLRDANTSQGSHKDLLTDFPTVRPGFVFECWRYDNGQVPAYLDNTQYVGSYRPTDNFLALYAVWNLDDSVNNIIIRYDTNNGAPATIPDSSPQYAADPYPFPAEPTRGGYNFAGWYSYPPTEDADGNPIANGTRIEQGDRIDPTLHMRDDGYEVNPDGTFSDPSPEDHYNGGDGYYTENDGETVVLVMWAHWTPIINGLRVIFHTDPYPVPHTTIHDHTEISVTAGQSYGYNRAVVPNDGQSPVPWPHAELDGYQFLGWIRDPNATHPDVTDYATPKNANPKLDAGIALQSDPNFVDESTIVRQVGNSNEIHLYPILAPSNLDGPPDSDGSQAGIRIVLRLPDTNEPGAYPADQTRFVDRIIYVRAESPILSELAEEAVKTVSYYASDAEPDIMHRNGYETLNKYYLFLHEADAYVPTRTGDVTVETCAYPTYHKEFWVGVRPETWTLYFDHSQEGVAVAPDSHPIVVDGPFGTLYPAYLAGNRFVGWSLSPDEEIYVTPEDLALYEYDLSTDGEEDHIITLYPFFEEVEDEPIIIPVPVPVTVPVALPVPIPLGVAVGEVVPVDTDEDSGEEPGPDTVPDTGDRSPYAYFALLAASALSFPLLLKRKRREEAEEEA
ncbi:MAG: InlB B-repeat-containing protein [Oscillospiraceae bacterium]|jgi:uncharacterized repeat protein (TIGR02543 family)|nr:InlB B-repeat-containing protein [Oscillospiraceae bacterium]